MAKLGTMPFAQQLFTFYLKASIHVALAATALAGATMVLLPLAGNGLLLAFVFFSTVVGYNFVKYGVEAHKYATHSRRYYKRIQHFSLLCAAAALYCLSGLSVAVWAAVGVLGLLSLLYAVPLWPGTQNLRSLGGLKIYLVALVWTGVTVALPLIAAQRAVHWQVWVLALQRFVLVLVLLLPFEIRDLPKDDRRLRTLPQVLGVKNTQRLGVVLALVVFALTFLKQEFTPLEVVLRAVLSGLLVAVVLFQNKSQSPYFVSFWVEGIPIGWLGLLGLAELFC